MFEESFSLVPAIKPVYNLYTILVVKLPLASKLHNEVIEATNQE